MELGELGESMQEQERLVLFLVERNLLVSGATIEEIGSRKEGQEDRCLVNVFSGRTEDGVIERAPAVRVPARGRRVCSFVGVGYLGLFGLR